MRLYKAFLVGHRSLTLQQRLSFASASGSNGSGVGRIPTILLNKRTGSTAVSDMNPPKSMTSPNKSKSNKAIMTKSLAKLQPHTTLIHFPSGEHSVFDNIWLRDHCRCSSCIHPATQQRQLDTISIPENIQPKSIQVTQQQVTIVWSNDQHVSVFPLDWLRQMAYNPRLVPRLEASDHKLLWDKDLITKQGPPCVEYHEVMQSEKGVAKWLQLIDIYGFALVKNVPPTPEDTAQLAKRIAFIRETHYGGFWDFTANLEHGDMAYTNLALGAHTDTTYFTDPVGLQMFHLLEFKGKGGQSLLVDGFRVAQQFKMRYPRDYEILTKIRVPCQFVGDTATRMQPELEAPTLTVDPKSGRLIQIRYNLNDRAPLRDLPADQVRAYYSSLRKFSLMLRQPEFEYWYQLEPGTVVIFDNWRVLHGRASFTGHRRLAGCYLNRDDYVSRLVTTRHWLIEK